MNKLREISFQALNKEVQDIDQSNRMWDKRAKDFAKTNHKTLHNYLEVMKEKVDIRGEKILDIGCGTGRYLKLLLDEGAKAEGLEPSKGMVDQAKIYLKESGYQEDFMIHELPLQEFRPREAYDYVFISNNPVIGYYSNYKKILSLAKKGVLVGSWLNSYDSLFESISQELGVKGGGHGGKNLLYLFNLLVGDGYQVSFDMLRSCSSQKEFVDESISRYVSWLYGSEYSKDDFAKIQSLVDQRKDENGKILIHRSARSGVLYINLKK